MATYEITNITIPSGDVLNIEDSTRTYSAGTYNVCKSTNAPLPGLITSSSKSIVFTVQTDKSMENISSLTLYGMSPLTVRTISGQPYYGNVQLVTLSSLPSGVTATVAKINDTTLRITLTGTNTFVTTSGGSTAVTNNTPLTVTCSYIGITMT